jgi:hypothetical protein
MPEPRTMSDPKILPFRPPDRRKPQNVEIREEINNADNDRDTIRKWISLADQYLKRSEK